MKKFRLLLLLFCLMLPFALIACENKNQSTLSTPSEILVVDKEIIFSQVSDAQYYVLLINGNEIVIDPLHSKNVQIIDNKLHYDASRIMISGNDYEIKVKATASDKKDSAYSSALSVKFQPNLNAPANLKINTSSKVLSWDNVENASFYLVKVITPYNTVLFDEYGQVVDGRDSQSIKKAQLTAYSFSSNQFNFSSILSQAGFYKFYVQAVSTIGDKYVESEFSQEISFKHVVSLDYTLNFDIYKVDGDLHMLTTVDENANTLFIKCDSFEKGVKIDDENQCLASGIIRENNLLDINLNEYFNNISVGEEDLDFSKLTTFNFETKVGYLQANENDKIYLDSAYSNKISYVNTQDLEAVNFVVEFSEIDNAYLISWDKIENCSGYKILLSKDGEVKTFVQSLDNTSFMVDDFNAVYIKTLGGGNYNDSKFSQIVDNVDNSEIIDTNANLQFNNQTNTLSWKNYNNAKYLLFVDEQEYVLNNNSKILDFNKFNKSKINVKLTVLKDGFKPLVESLNLDVVKYLNAPTIKESQSTASTKQYTINFSPVENAIGYYAYVKKMEEDDSKLFKINKLYTTTSIDLTQYINSTDEYTDYTVKIQAVANKYSVYKDSNVSESFEVSVSKIKTLQTPEFYKVDGVISPIITSLVNGQTTYSLWFYGVSGASSYEILINNNFIIVPAGSPNFTGIYKITSEINSLFNSAKIYNISIRAIANPELTNVESSPRSQVYSYRLFKQLNQVSQFEVVLSDNNYMLNFTPVDNASSYEVKIIKANDQTYQDKLTLKNLTANFEITTACDITDYLTWSGIYQIYMRALASKDSGNYSDSDLSENYQRIEKLESLKSPTNIEFVNENENNYKVSWTGDNNANYYLVKLIDANNFNYEFSVYGQTSTNINEYLNVPGSYKVAIYSMVTPGSAASANYASSAKTEKTLTYSYNEKQDFKRYAISMFDSSFDFSVDNILELKNILWYHLIYSNAENKEIRLFINNVVDNSQTLDIRNSIIALANSGQSLYNFGEDENWVNNLLTNGSSRELFSYLCEKLLSIYPDLKVVKDFNVVYDNDDNIFTLYYYNELNKNKITAEHSYLGQDYANDYQYLDANTRRMGSSNVLKDDNVMLVSTTEQLLQAIMSGKKPKFYGDCEVAKQVYNNARNVLAAIVNDDMSDIQKVNAIFEWIQYAINYDYRADKMLSGTSFIAADIEDYGLRDCYYLEGLFLNLSNGTKTDLEFNLSKNSGTENLYAKAFSLLCGLEGIQTRIIYGNYLYNPTYQTSITELLVNGKLYRRPSNKVAFNINHIYNKVLLKTTDDGEYSWFNIDLTLSDNKLIFEYETLSYSFASHTYFLVSDEFLMSNNFATKSNEVDSLENVVYNSTKDCLTDYDYYSNSNIELTAEQVKNVSPSLTIDFEDTYAGFVYGKTFNSSIDYQQYCNTSFQNKLQAFVFDNFVYATYLLDKNVNNGATIEFKINSLSNTLSTYGQSSLTTLITYQSNLVSGYRANMTHIDGTQINVVQVGDKIVVACKLTKN